MPKKRRIVSKISTQEKRQKLNHATDTKQNSLPFVSTLLGGDCCYHKSSNSNAKTNIYKNTKRKLHHNYIPSNKRRKVNIKYNHPMSNKIPANPPISNKISKHSHQQKHSRIKKNGSYF